MKVSKKSWHYRYLSWAIGYPAERNRWGYYGRHDDPRGVVSYCWSLVMRIIFLPIVLIMKGFERFVDRMLDWLDTHHVELKDENGSAK